MQKIILIFLIFIFPLLSSSQKFEKEKVQVLNQDFEVNSFFDVNNGYSRNYAIVDLPDHCYAFIYSVTITKKGIPQSRQLLFDVVSQIPDVRVQAAKQVVELILGATNTERIDVFIMNNAQELSKFYAKENFKYCHGIEHTNNNCYLATPCGSNKIYIGLRNNNFIDGLIVNLQVLAFYLRIPEKTNSENNYDPNKSIGLAMLESLLKGANEKNTEPEKNTTTKNWNTQEGKSNIKIIRKYLDNFIAIDSMKLKYNTTISSLKNCVINKITQVVNYSEYISSSGDWRKQTLGSLYLECAKPFYFTRSDDYKRASSIGDDGWNYFLMGDYDKSFECYERALNIKPLAFVKENVGLYYLIKGMPEAARNSYKDAISIIQKSDEPIGYKRRDLREGINDLMKVKLTKNIIGPDEMINLLQEELINY